MPSGDKRCRMGRECTSFSLQQKYVGHGEDIICNIEEA